MTLILLCRLILLTRVANPMSRSSLYTYQGHPSAALTAAMEATDSRTPVELLYYLRYDTEAHLKKLREVPSIGRGFIATLRRALKDGLEEVMRLVPDPVTRHDKRPVTMMHIETGQIIAAPSVAAFTRLAGLKPVAQFQFHPVFKGQKLTLHGWGEAAVLGQHLSVKDIFGNRYEGTIAELRRSLSGFALNRLRKGQVVGSLAPIEHDYGDVMPSKSIVATEYSLRRGKRVYRGVSLKEVGYKAGISAPSVCDLVHGYRGRVKGVTLSGVKTRRRRDPLAAKLEPVRSER